MRGRPFTIIIKSVGEIVRDELQLALPEGHRFPSWPVEVGADCYSYSACDYQEERPSGGVEPATKQSGLSCVAVCRVPSRAASSVALCCRSCVFGARDRPVFLRDVLPPTSELGSGFGR
jgi:hypothetical protein